MPLAVKFPSVELILFAVAILIGIIGKVVEAAREVRRKSLEAEKKGGRRFGEEPAPRPQPKDRNRSFGREFDPPVPTHPVPTPPPLQAPEPARRPPRPRIRFPREALPQPIAIQPPALASAPYTRPHEQPYARAVDRPYARPSETTPRTRHAVVALSRQSIETLRQAIVLHEVLGLPRAIHPFDPALRPRRQ